MKINKTAREKERFEGGSGFKATHGDAEGRGWVAKKGGQNRGSKE